MHSPSPTIDVEEIDRRLAAGRNLPSEWYTDRSLFDLELDAIFTDAWQYLTPLRNVEHPGSVATGTVGRTSIVVVRGADGELRGFVNACRHRGFRVVPGDGRCRRLQCGYHGWVYELDGSLARAGRAPAESNIVTAELGLLPVSVDVFAQGVFVNPTPDAGRLLDAYPGLSTVADAIGIDHEADHYVPFSRYVMEQRSNWKLWYDNGTECYHCPIVHRSSFGAAYDTRDGDYDFVTHSNFSHARFEPASRSTSIVGGGYRSIQLFPGTQFIQQDDLMVMGRIVPTGPGTCTFVADYLAERGADPARVGEWVKLWNQTYAEDASVVDTVQQNLESGRVPELLYVDGLEDVSRFFHGLIWSACRERVAR